MTDDRNCLIIIGLSGGGKTTLLRLLSGLEIPSAGEVFVNGERILYHDKAFLRRYRKTIAVVFQSYNLFPHLTALDNTILPLVKVFGMEKKLAKEKAAVLFERFGLSANQTKKPIELSGGQKQRVALIRSLLIEPQYLLLDEPTSALDPESTKEVLDMIIDLKSQGMKLALVTHNMRVLRRLEGDVVFIHQGKIHFYGSVDKLFLSDDEVVKNFINTI